MEDQAEAIYIQGRAPTETSLFLHSGKMSGELNRKGVGKNLFPQHRCSNLLPATAAEQILTSGESGS